MAEHGSLDMEQLRLEAQNRWLRPAEICEILRNHKTFQISTEPSLRPPSGSSFLFDRRATRYFRKDGHNWRKKNKGNTVKEAHEKLKVGNVKMLHCYYAHGEENENFQRRSYSMLELDLMHIVFVHYLKVKNNDTNIGCIREIDEATTNFPVGSPSSSCPSTNYNKMPSENTESTSQPFLKVVAEKSHQASSGFHSNLGLPQMDNGPLMDKMDSGLISSCFQCPYSDNHDGPLSSTPGALFRGDKCQDGDGSTSIIDSNELHLLSWKELLNYGEANFQSLPFHPKNSLTQSAASGTSLEAENFTQDQLLAITNSVEEFIGSPSPIQTTNGQINDTNITSIREIYKDIANFLVGSPLSSFSPTDHNRVPSENTDSMSPPFLKSVAEENHQESSSLHSKLGCLQNDNGPLMDKMDAVLISAQFQWHNSDIEQLLLEALHRWLRPAEICVLLCNYHKFRMLLEPANRPSSGSLFLFDRKMLRYFRKDGHKWRKKKDGKTVKEAYEKLKVGSVDVLHCYHAHGEENENFQRRSYWMLEEDMMHIVIVHYLEVKCNRTNVGGNRETDEVTSSIQMGSPLAFSFPANHTKAPSGNTDSTSPRSTLMPLCEDAVYLEFFPENHEDRSSIPGVDHVSHVHGDRARDGDDGNLVIESQRTLGLGSREEVLEQFTLDYDNVSSCASMTSIPQPANTGIILHQQSMIEGVLLAGDNAVKEKLGGPLPIQSNFQIPFEDNSLDLPKWHMDPSSNLEMSYNLGTRLFEQGTNDAYLQNAPEPFSTCFDQQNLQALQNNLQIQLTDVESQCVKKVYSKDHMHVEGNINYTDSVKQTLLDENEGLKKVDSFSVWASKELGELDNLHMQSSSGVPWSTVEGGNVANHSSLSPSLSQVQLYSIIDFSPKWAYTDSETEVLITGTFLKSQQEAVKCNWACMFGEVEVPAEPLADGILCCHAPPHNVGQVPFYVTCSNGLACSEVREFDYKVRSRTVLGSSRGRNIPFGSSGLSNDFSSFWHSCNKELEGNAIFMSSDKEFCTRACRMKQILIDEEIQSTKLLKNDSKSGYGRELFEIGGSKKQRK